MVHVQLSRETGNVPFSQKENFGASRNVEIDLS